MFYKLCLKCCQRLPKISITVNRCQRRSISVVFYGSDEFSLKTVKLLHRNLSQSQFDKKPIKRLDLVLSSHSNPVSRFGQKAGLQCFQFPHALPTNVYDIGIVSSFGHLIPSSAIKACRLGMLNIHGSLLPRWRGAAPVNYAVLNGDEVTGITIMRIKPKKFDIGDIVMQKEIPIRSRITAQELKAEMAPIGAQMLMECLSDLEGHLSRARPQPEDGITYAPKFDDSDGLIDWSSMTATEIDRRFRAFTGFIDIHSHWTDGSRVRLYDIVDPEVVASLDLNRVSDCDAIPGSIYYDKKRRILCVKSAANSWSAFGSLSLKGHKKISAHQFVNGFVTKHKTRVVLGSCNSLPS